VTPSRLGRLAMRFLTDLRKRAAADGAGSSCQQFVSGALRELGVAVRIWKARIHKLFLALSLSPQAGSSWCEEADGAGSYRGRVLEVFLVLEMFAALCVQPCVLRVVALVWGLSVLYGCVLNPLCSFCAAFAALSSV
jgi:hypothetical protein